MSTMIAVATETRLAELEGTIEKGMARFVEVGRALAEIAHDHLYREQGFETFALYCDQRWGLAARTAYYFIQASHVVEMVPHGDRLNFSQAKELSVLSGAKQVEFVQSHPVEDMTRLQLAAAVAVVRRAELNLVGQEERSLAPYIRFAEEVPENADVIIAPPLPDWGLGLNLREGGSLLMPCAPFELTQPELPRPLDLNHHWTIALVTGSGPPITREQARMYNMWTPVLWFTRGAYRGDYVPDVYPDLASFVRKITRPDDLVVELYSATGELAKACARGRVTWVGVRATGQAIETIQHELAA